MAERSTTRKARPRVHSDDLRFIHESLIEVCDLIGEAMAAGESTPQQFPRELLAEINLKVWKTRWDLSMTGGHLVSLADEIDEPEPEATP